MLQMTTPAALRQRASRARRQAQDPDAYRAKQALAARDYRRRVRAAQSQARPLPDDAAGLIHSLVGPEERAREAEAEASAAQLGRLEAAADLAAVLHLLTESRSRLAYIRDQILGAREETD